MDVDDIDLLWVGFRVKLEEMVVSDKNEAGQQTLRDLKEEVVDLKKEIVRLNAVIDAYKELMKVN